MDASLEKSCLEEISHTVLDAQQKISVRSISNNYGLTFLDAVNILQQWIDNNGAKVNLVKEFIVRGFDPKRGGAFITVVNEKKLKAVQSKVSQLSSVLYAVEVAAESSRKLIIPEEQEFKVINLPLQSDKRDVQVFTPAANPPSTASVKQEPKSKINSMFAASASKPKQEPPKPATVKEEKQSPPAATGKKDTAKAGSPQKSPSKGSSPSKKKDAKKAVTGKASIASFFSNKPSSAKPTQKASSSGSPATAEVKKEKESPKEAAAKEPKKENITNGTKKHEDTPRWKRMISDESDGDDVIPNTPQAKKEPAKKGGRKTQALKKAASGKANPSKRSRILQVEDSSEEEDEEDEARKLREPEERLIKFDAEESEDAVMRSDDEEEKEKKKPSPENPVENDSNSLNRKRTKVKKWVTKNFMDDDGYMTTIKEYVMASASEDEAEGGDASNNNAADGEKKAPAAEKKEPAASGGGDDKKSKSDSKPASKKPSKVTPPTPKTKQGSIMSFFSKK